MVEQTELRSLYGTSGRLFWLQSVMHAYEFMRVETRSPTQMANQCHESQTRHAVLYLRTSRHPNGARWILVITGGTSCKINYHMTYYRRCFQPGTQRNRTYRSIVADHPCRLLDSRRFARGVLPRCLPSPIRVSNLVSNYRSFRCSSWLFVPAWAGCLRFQCRCNNEQALPHL